jgi:hypothetical protein
MGLKWKGRKMKKFLKEVKHPLALPSACTIQIKLGIPQAVSYKLLTVLLKIESKLRCWQFYA